MKSLKINFVAAIAILGLLFAFTSESSYSSVTNLMYELDESSGDWTPVTGIKGQDYDCDPSSEICTAEFPSTVDPNDQENDSHPGTVEPSNIVRGDYFLK